jgi:hypothetical protein
MCARKNSTTVLNATNVSHLDPQFTGVCHLLIKINTEKNHICIRGLGDPDKDDAISCSSRFVARLCDQKSFASSHHNINKLRVKLATVRDASLVRLPPSEAALRQHILRASFQTKVWHTSCLAKPPIPSPMEYEWRTVNDSLHPVYFEGNMSAEFLRDLVCSCKVKSQCKRSCKFYSKFVNVMMGGCKRLLITKPSYKPWRAWNSHIFVGISQIV